MRQLLIVILATALLLGTVPEVLASEALGVVSSLQGKVTVLRENGTTESAGANLSLYPGDRLVTDKGASIRVLLGNDHFFVLHGDTTATVDDLSPYASEPSPVVALETGHLSTGLVIKSISIESNQLVVYTPGAVIIPKLTTFDTIVGLDGSTAITVSDGTITIKQRTNVLTLARGQAAIIAVDGMVNTSVPDTGTPEKAAAWRTAQAAKVHDTPGTILPQLQILLQLAMTRFESEVASLGNAAQSFDELLTEYGKAFKERSRRFSRLEKRVQAREKKISKRIKWFREAVNLVSVRNALLQKVYTELDAGGNSEDKGLVQSNRALVADRMVEINTNRVRTGTLLDELYAKYEETIPGVRRSGSTYGRSLLIVPNKREQ